MLKKKVLISVSLTNKEYLIRKLSQTNICFENYKEVNNIIELVISKDDYDMLENYDYKKVITLDKYIGVYNFINILRLNIEKLVVALSIIFLLFLSSNFIYKININSSDINLKKNLIYSLEEYNIKPFTIKKGYDALQNIKSKIKNKYASNIEWIEIEKYGNVYNVYIIKRKKQNKISNREKCNYVANKSGTVKSIKVQKGVLLVQENNYVTKGDVLISGDIFYNEELKDQVCAKGTIKGEVWYKVNVNYPLYITKTMNEKSKYNISFNFLDNNYYMFNNKYPKIIKSRGIGNNKFGINVMKNIKEKKIHKRIKYNEALEKSLDIAKEKVLKKTYNKGQIIDENVLKKEIKNDKIIVEVLVTVEEELGIIEKL